MSHDTDSGFNNGQPSNGLSPGYDLDTLTIDDVKKMVHGLSPIQLKFTTEFLKSQFNIGVAAEAAGLTLYEAKAALELNAAIRTICLWYMHKQAMPEEEILARIATMARADIGSFLKKTERGVFNREGTEIEKYEVWELDIQGMKDRGLTFLIKKLGYDKNGNMQWELHDSMKALQMLAKAYGLFDQVAKFNIDWSTLSQQQVERIARGEDPRTVVMTPNALSAPNAPSNPGQPN